MLLKFLTKVLPCLLVSLLLATGILLEVPYTARGAELPDKPVYPPRIYFTQASLNKSGIVSAIQGEDNFVRLFVPAMDASEHAIPADGLTCKLLLPEGVAMLPEVELPLEIKKTTVDGQLMQEVIVTLPSEDVRRAGLKTSTGMEMTLWYRADDLHAGENYPIRLLLEMQGKTCFTDEAKLHVYDALQSITPIDPNFFRLWLHYGPSYRKGKWDELATTLHHSGINTVQVMNWSVEMAKAMKDRGFSVIAQRLGSYAGSYDPGTAVSDVVAQGQEWFKKDDGGEMEAILPYADAVIWDFEPSPQDIVTDDTTLALFRKSAKIPDDEKLDEQAIKAKYMKPWTAFRQKQFATIVKDWADWTRGINGNVKTILTEGRCNVFDPRGQVDYRNVAGDVTYFDPMNFSGPGAIHGMRQWKAAMPDEIFMGCQNVAFSPQSPVTTSANTIMLQIASAALMGNAGTSVYPGQTMDAENFVLFNRVMGFLGKNQDILWKGIVHPKDMTLTLLPKQDETITLGGGDTLHNVYPDWTNDAVAQTYQSKSGDAYLAGIVNWNASEPCYAKIQIAGESGRWMITDDESRQVYTFDGKESLDAATLAGGVVVSVPTSEYRGFRVVHFDADAVKNYKRIALEDLRKEFAAYASTSSKENEGDDQAGPVRISYSDIDGDKVLEYCVTTASQKVWLSQAGSIVRWQAGSGTIDGALCRDQIWLPSSERNNPTLDTTMKVEAKKAGKDQAEITLSRNATLSSYGSMADIHLTKKFTISNRRPEIAVETTIQNTSLSTQGANLELSYRVHNRLRYGGAMAVWADNGAELTNFGALRDSSVPSAGLDAALSQLVFENYAQTSPQRLASFGDYRLKEQSLLAFTPARPDDLLQMLRWLAADSQEGTIEWMYRPVKLGSGQSWKASYEINLWSGVEKPDHATLQALRPSSGHPKKTRGERS